jgi:hypothetical protein
MKATVTAFLFMFCSGASFAQPRYSPAIRTERTMQWMHDSLHITPAQAEKINKIELSYEQNMDKANDAADKRYKERTQKQLMHKKDANIKAVLKNERSYQRYYKREKQIREIESRVYNGPHQPL